jgi:hypothetical protein
LFDAHVQFCSAIVSIFTLKHAFLLSRVAAQESFQFLHRVRASAASAARALSDADMVVVSADRRNWRVERPLTSLVSIYSRHVTKVSYNACSSFLPQQLQCHVGHFRI